MASARVGSPISYHASIHRHLAGLDDGSSAAVSVVHSNPACRGVVRQVERGHAPVIKDQADQSWRSPLIQLGEAAVRRGARPSSLH